jgi:hypothetical protein
MSDPTTLHNVTLDELQDDYTAAMIEYGKWHNRLGSLTWQIRAVARDMNDTTDSKDPAHNPVRHAYFKKITKLESQRDHALELSQQALEKVNRLRPLVLQKSHAERVNPKDSP